jgi:quercetin dioxygenase-like cupin family protein
MDKIFFSSIAFFSSLLAMAQPAVRNEPGHHNVFENEYIRILDVFLPPHDTTQYHIHNTPSVLITFTKNATGSQLTGRQPVKDISVAGYTWYDSLVTPRIHRVWNEDSVWFHVMDIELTGSKPRSNEPLLRLPSLQLLFNEPLANGYRLQLQSGNNIQFPVSTTGYLLLSPGETAVDYRVNESVQHRLMKSGHYIWIEPGKLSSITAMDNTTAAFLLLQLK